MGQAVFCPVLPCLSTLLIMDKKAAAAALGVSEKTVSRYAASGKLPQRYIKGKTGRQLDFDQADVERLKEELDLPIEGAVVAANQPSQAETGREGALSTLAPPAPVDAQIARLAQVVRAVIDAGQRETRQPDTLAIASKMLLNLEDARALTGLSRQVIVAAIKAGELPSVTIGRGYKLRPADVQTWLDSMFKTAKRGKK